MLNIEVANTILYCKNWDECVVFYKTKLKLPIMMSRGWFIEFKLNESARLSIADAAKTTITSNAGKGITITFRVTDIFTTHSYLIKLGVNPTPIKEHPWGAKVVYIYDPDGNRIEFWSPNRRNVRID